MTDSPDALHYLAGRLREAFEGGQADMDANELREACRPVVPHDVWECAHAWKLSVAIRDAYERERGEDGEGDHRGPCSPGGLSGT